MADHNLPVFALVPKDAPASFCALPARIRRIVLEEAQGVPLADIMGKNRAKAPFQARARIFARLRTEPAPDGRIPSLPRIGAWFGLDHTSVLNALRRVGVADRRAYFPPKAA